MAAIVDQYAHSINLRPHLASDLYSDLGVQLASIGQLRAAASAYSHAIELAPTHAVAYNNLASLIAAMDSTLYTWILCSCS